MRCLSFLVALVCLTTVYSAAVEDTKSVLLEEQNKAIDSSPELKRMIRKTNKVMRGRSFFQTMGNEIMNYLGYGSDDYDDYDEEHEYFYPSLDANVLAGGGSSYSFYNPYGNNYHPARDDNFEEEDSGYGWGDFMFDAAVVAVPMAMVLAAMPTGLFTIPVMGRSIDNNIEETLKPFELPILRAVEEADFLSYTTRECQEKVFCEVAQIGRHKESSLMQKLTYFVANLTPDNYADAYGLGKLFKSSREGHCEEYKCVPLMSANKL